MANSGDLGPNSEAHHGFADEAAKLIEDLRSGKVSLDDTHVNVDAPYLTHKVYPIIDGNMDVVDGMRGPVQSSKKRIEKCNAHEVPFRYYPHRCIL